MRTLEQYIESNNRWNAIFGEAPTTFPLTQAEADQLARKIDSELSPENLHCDGEISGREAHKKFLFLTTVARELKAYCRQAQLTEPEMYEM